MAHEVRPISSEEQPDDATVAPAHDVGRSNTQPVEHLGSLSRLAAYEISGPPGERPWPRWSGEITCHPLAINRRRSTRSSIPPPTPWSMTGSGPVPSIRTFSADCKPVPDQPRDEFVNSKPNRPLMQRWPSVTEESIGEVTFTMVSSWAWSVTAQPTPQ
jgi:hypothetical protein